jgi:uncharacterized protein YfaS (alpha-2-macroglobulin family)
MRRPLRSVPARLLLLALLSPLAACDKGASNRTSVSPSRASPAPAQELAELPPFPPPRARPPAAAATAANTAQKGPARAHVVTAARATARDGGGVSVTVELDPPLAATAAPGAVSPATAAAIPSPAPEVRLEGHRGTPTVTWLDLRTVRLDLPEAPPPATRLKVQIAVGAPPLEATVIWRPLSVSSPLHESAWMASYPVLVPAGARLPLNFSEPITAAALRAALQVRATSHENPAYPGEVNLAGAQAMPFSLEAVADAEAKPVADPSQAPPAAVSPEGPARSWVVTPEGGLPPGRLVHLTVAGELLSPPSGRTAAEPWTMSVHGPRPLELTDVSCDPTCTPLATWSATFSDMVHPETLGDCIKVYPPSALRDFTVWGHTVSFRLARAKPGSVVRVSATSACRPLHGDKGPLRSVDVPVLPPEPALVMARGLRTWLRPASDAPLAMGLSVVGAQRVEVSQTRLDTGDLPRLLARLSAVLGGEALDDAALAGLALRAPKVLAVRGAMAAPQKLEVPIDALGAGRSGRSEPGWVLVRARLPNGAEPAFAEAAAVVQVTELAVTVKSGGGGTTVRVASLVDGSAVEGARVRLFAGDGKPLWDGMTPADGVVSAAVPASRYGSEGGVRWVVAERGGDVALVDRSDALSGVPRWRFDVPVDWDAPGRHLSGLVFTERGIYRPGESVKVQAYALAGGGVVPEVLANTPLSVTVKNPLSQEVLATTLTTGAFGDLTVEVPLGPESPTGSWWISVEPPRSAPGGPPSALAPDISLSGDFRVESYRAPNAVTRIEALAVTRDRVQATVGGKYWFGAPMANGRFRWSLHRAKDGTRPAGHPEFLFGEEASRWETSEEDGASRELAAGEGSLDAAGVARLDAAFALLPEAKAPDFDQALVKALETTPWTLILEVEAIDADGQASSARRRARLEPPELVPGLRLTQWVAKVGAQTVVEAIVVAPPAEAGPPDGAEGALAAAPLREGAELVVELVHRTWTSTREEDATGEATWHSTSKDVVVATQKLKSAGAPLAVKLTPKAGGQHLVRARVVDGRGRVALTEATLWVEGEDASWAERDDEQVVVTATGRTWNVGEKAQFVIQSPFPKARAWVTVETNRVLSQQLVELQGLAPTIEVAVTEAMAPNAWVGVLLLPVEEPFAGTKGDEGEEDSGDSGDAFDEEGGGEDGEARADEDDWGEPVPASDDGFPDDEPPLAGPRFGYARLPVSRAARALRVAVAPASPVARPGDTVKVALEVRDAAGKPAPGQVTFMAVDEAVLTLTGYQTPDVDAALSRERGLGVETNDLRRGVLLGLKEEDGMKAEWGGGGETGVTTRYRSRFATTAAFMPAVVVGPDGRAEVSFALPDNLTTFRLMAVAATADGRFGRAEAPLVVQKPLTLRPGLPRFLTSGDQLSFGAIAQAVDPKAPFEVDVTASVSGPAALKGPATALLRLSDTAPQVAGFALAAGKVGEATVSLAARERGGAVRQDAVAVTLPVRHHAAPRHDSVSGVLRGEASGTAHTAWRVALPEDTLPDAGVLRVTVENTRLGAVRNALKYLAEYPYGCVEQTASMLLPLAALHEAGVATHALGLDAAGVLARLQAGVDRLVAMQRWSGGLAYWPDSDAEHGWGSVYGAHALHAAAKLPGVKVSADVLKRLRAYLAALVAASTGGTPGHAEPETRALAAWLLMREASQPTPAARAAPAGAAPSPAAPAAGLSVPAPVPSLRFPGAALAPGDPGLNPAALVTALIEASPIDKTPTSVLALLALASAADPRPEALTRARGLLTAATARAVVEGNLARLPAPTGLSRFMGSVETDAAFLALAVASITPEDALLPKLHEGLIASQREGRWPNTLANALATVALAGQMKQDLRGSPWVAEVTLGDATILEARMAGDAVSGGVVELPMARLKASQGKALSFVRRGGAGNLHYAIHLTSFPTAREEAPLDAGFRVTRRYVRAEGPQQGLTASAFRVGELVRVHVAVEVPADRHYVAVEDPLPAGLEPVLLTERAASGWGLEGGSPTFGRAEQRDDRVLLFADHLPTGRHEHSYLLRATTPGSFTAVGAHAHAMYAPHLEGRSGVATVSVAP